MSLLFVPTYYVIRDGLCIWACSAWNLVMECDLPVTEATPSPSGTKATEQSVCNHLLNGSHRPILSTHRTANTQSEFLHLHQLLAKSKYKYPLILLSNTTSGHLFSYPRSIPFLLFQPLSKPPATVIMHFSSFLAPMLLLVGQITIISATLTPEEILIRFRDAVTDVDAANSDLSNTTALNALTQYSVRSFYSIPAPWHSALMTPSYSLSCKTPST